jgi:AcrR family transcriptional regulator
MAQLLDAAAEVFSERGYAATTTIAIAERAGVSPGTLYQFYANKESIAEDLARGYLDRLHRAHEAVFVDAGARLPLDDLLDRMIDPIVQVATATPGFKALFADADMPERAVTATRALQAGVVGAVDEVLAARAPSLPATDRARMASVIVQVFRALLPMVVAAQGTERAAVIRELKGVLRGYLQPVDR